METAAIIVSVVGALGSFAGAIWLLLGFSPDDPRYSDEGELYPGRQTSSVVPNLLRDQRKVAALITLSAGLQFVGLVLGIAAD